MSSLFRARRSEEPPSSGGRLLRRRSRTPPAPPYARPPETSSAVAQSGRPRWLAGLISGAGKLISSVLPSKLSISPPSDGGEEETSSEFDEDEKELCGLNQGQKESESAKKHMARSLAVVPHSESKLVIEKLLMKETFSRDECDRLTKLILSRVLDFPSPEVCGEETPELRSRTTGNGFPLSGVSPSFGQKRSFPERVSYSSSKPNAHSPESSVFEARIPHIYNKAIVEAKKWLEEKKLASNPKYDPECGPCTLNTDMLQYELEDVACSAVDVAKSYMRSLPPWRYPSFSDVGFITPPSSRMCCYNDEIFHETADNSLSSSKGRKRDHLVSGSLDALDETRRVRLRSADDKVEVSKFKQVESSAGVSEHENSRRLLVTDNKEVYAGDHCSDVAIGLPDKKEVHANQPLKTDDTKSSNIISEPEKVVCGATIQNSVSDAQHPEPTNCLDENQPLQTMEVADEFPIPHDTLASASRLVEPNGNQLAETQVMLTKNVELVVPSDVDNDVDISDVRTSDKETSTRVERTVLTDNSSELYPVSSVAVTNCTSDSRPQDGNSRTAKNANASLNESSAYGYSAEVNANSDHETLNRETDKFVPQNGNSKRMKPVESMLNEPRRTTKRRERKVVVKSRRRRKS